MNHTVHSYFSNEPLAEFEVHNAEETSVGDLAEKIQIIDLKNPTNENEG